MAVADQLAAAPSSQRRIGLYLGLLAGAMAALLLAGWSTPNFLTFDNMFVVVRAASITGDRGRRHELRDHIRKPVRLVCGTTLGLAERRLRAVSSREPVGAAELRCRLRGSCARRAFCKATSSRLFEIRLLQQSRSGHVFVGLAAYVSGNGNIRIHNEAATWVGTVRPLGVPIQSWVFVAWALIGLFLVEEKPRRSTDNAQRSESANGCSDGTAC